MADEPNPPLSVAVLGVGGVGGLLAGALARQGHHVVCIASEATCEVLLQNGITVRSKKLGEFHASLKAVPALRSKVDACLIAVKATQLESAIARVPPHALGGGFVVPFLNGVEHVASLRQRYGDAVVPAIIRVEAARVSPGVIEQASPFLAAEFALAPGADAARATRVRALERSFAGAGIDTAIRDDEQTMLWAKLCFLGPLALMTTHATAPAGVVRTERRAELLAVIHEASQVANRAGAKIDEQAIVKNFDAIPATMQSSMQRDAAAGQTTEIEAIGGAILRAAERFQVQVPSIARLVADLRARQPKAAKS